MGVKVTLKYDPVWTPLEWAKKNCPSYIGNDMHIDEYNKYVPTKIDYFFGTKRDAVWFALRWS